jgi:small subunit ribosomal protein S13
MPRIAGIDIPDHKKLAFAMRSIYGIGPKRASEICKKAQIDPDKRARDLTAEETNRIQKVLEEYAVEGDLRSIINDNFNRLKRIRCYRGLRHIAGLPSRGQRTRSNSRTRRSTKRRTVGSMTKEMAAKLDVAKKNKE